MMTRMRSNKFTYMFFFFLFTDLRMEGAGAGHIKMFRIREAIVSPCIVNLSTFRSTLSIYLFIYFVRCEKLK